MTTSGRPTQDETNMDVRAAQRMLGEGCLRSRGHAGRQQALTRMGVLVTTGALVLSPFPAPAIALESDGSSAGSATAAEGQCAQPDEGAPPAKPEGDSPDGAGASSTPGVPPSDAPDAQAPGGTGRTDAQSFDYQGSYAGTLTADGESVSSEDQIATSTASDLVAALVQNGGTLTVSGSTLRSAIASGSMFYLTNTSADIVLSNTTLDFDSSAASLLVAAGNDSNGWGTAGKNGATAKLTGIGQTLEGNIESDTISQVDVFLTEGTTWTGAAEISENATASTSDSPLSVSVDSSSSWVVAADSTVSNLTVESGGRVVDTNGKTVAIMAGGKTVVQGDSGITVTVSGSYSTDYDASAAGSLASEAIDRSAFDEEYGTQTAFSMDGSAASGQREATESQGGSGNWWDGFLSFWRGVFGMGG